MHDGAGDFRGIFAARIVRRHDDPIGQRRSNLSHLRTLAFVAIATAAEHADQLARRSDRGAQRQQRFFERIGCVRVINDDERLPVAAEALHPPGRRRQCRQRGERRVERDAAIEQHSENAEQILRVEFADNARLHCAATPWRRDGERDAAAAHRDSGARYIGAGETVRDDALAAASRGVDQ